MADSLAHSSGDLPELIESLPLNCIVVGDNAYMPTERLLTPYCGADGLDFDNATFNFFLSQLRIRIEMCFALLTTKWRILRKHQEGSLETITKVIEACLKLHNYIIDFYGATDEQVSSPEVNQSPSRQFSRIVPTDEDDEPIMQLLSIRGTSLTRNALRDYVRARGLSRPGRNVERNTAVPNT
jgi:DDE superfamily endonuclease